MELLKISDAVLLAIIALVGTFLTLLAQVIMGLVQGRMRKEQKDLKVMVDGRLSELLAANEVKDQALGREAGRAEQKAETKIDAEVTAQQPIKLEIPKLVVEMKPIVPPPEEETKT